MRETVILGGARTAFGKLGGGFKDAKAAELGGGAIRGALDLSGVPPDLIDGVLMGMVLQGGAGQLPSRQAARRAGLKRAIPTDTVNKVCASGMRAVTLADQMIRAGDAEGLIAGGMECMSGASYSLPSGRWGARMGSVPLIDLMLHDGLLCAERQVHMGRYGDQAAKRYGISREEQDDWALRSHTRALEAKRSGYWAGELVPFALEKGSIAEDECLRPDTDAVKLASLKPVFTDRGTVTAGNAPAVSDGAAALVLMSRDAALRHGYSPAATIIGHATVAVEPSGLAKAPALAIRKLLGRIGLSLHGIDRIEINEAFAAVVLACGKLLEWDAGKVNVNGGAIALGHPIGASGARIVLTLVRQLALRGGGIGIAAICSGGAQGDAIAVRVDG